VLEQGLRRGHAIIAFTRRPHELAGSQGLAAVIHGDALNLLDVRKAVQGQDAVISAVGSSDIARNLIVAMQPLGCGEPPPACGHPGRLVFRAPYADLARAEGMLR